MKIPRVDLEEVATRNNMSLKEVESIVLSTRKGMSVVRKRILIKENNKKRSYVVKRHGVGVLKTPFGLFWMFDFSVDDQWKKYSVIVRGKLSANFDPVFQDPNKIFLRIDSGCESGQKFMDVTCDCRDQLLLAMQEIAKVGEGIVINLPPQDGRGMGGPFKLATMSLQEHLRLTTVEAASVITNGGPIDKRSYAGAVAVLRFMHVTQNREIHLMTNNPDKFKVFEENGYRAITRMPVVIEPTQYTRKHLEAKQLYFGHKNLVTGEDEK